MKLCSVCKKNIAVILTSKIENGKTEMVGLCIECAKKMGLPIMEQLIQQMDIKPEEFENLNEQMSNIMEEIDLDNIENIDDSGAVNPFMSLFNKNVLNSENEKSNSSKIDDKLNSHNKSEGESEVKTDKKWFNKKKKKFLDTYGTNLTDKAKNDQVDRIIGRNREIDRVIQILNRRTKNNPILIGEPGVGKTAIAEGLAVRIAERQVPTKLFNAEIYLLDLTAIVAGTQFRGQFEGRMKSIITEAKEFGNVILVIDEVHNIMGAGEVHGGAMNAANIIKPALAKGEIQVIGATTLEEYRKHI